MFKKIMLATTLMISGISAMEKENLITAAPTITQAEMKKLLNNKVIIKDGYKYILPTKQTSKLEEAMPTKINFITKMKDVPAELISTFTHRGTQFAQYKLSTYFSVIPLVNKLSSIPTFTLAIKEQGINDIVEKVEKMKIESNEVIAQLEKKKNEKEKDLLGLEKENERANRISNALNRNFTTVDDDSLEEELKNL